MKSKLIYQFALLLGVFLAFSCSNSSQQEIKIIRTKGIPWLFNVSKSSGTYSPRMLKDSTSGVALQDGDLLWAFDDKQEVQFFFQYSPGFGKELVFKMDTIQPFFTSLNDHIFSALIEDSSSWLWIKNEKREVLSGLHSINLALPLSEDKMNILSDLSKVNPGLNLCINANVEMKQLEKILSMFQPDWLFIGVDSVAIDDSLLLKFGKINTLYLGIGSKVSVAPYKLAQLKNLKNIMFSGYPKEGHKFNFKDFKRLSSLSLDQSTLVSTRNLNLPAEIKSLFFIHCEELTDISSLAANPKLKTLGFSECSKLKDISAIKGMKNLTWLSLPPSINQSQFDSLIPTLPSLEVLEMIYCDSIKNFDVLRKAERLRSLSLAAEKIDPASLYEMKNLELLVYCSRSDTDSTDNIQMKRLKAQLPNTLVVPGGGFCLGSGWILLIIPMVLLGIFLSKRVRQTPKGLNS
jgi:hypothetical protein